MHGKRWLPYLFILPSVVAMTILVFYPLANGIYLSFTDANQYNIKRQAGTKVIESSYKWIGFENYDRILFQERYKDVYYFWDTLKQTMIWTTSNIVLHISLGLALALLLNTKIRGRTVYRVLLIVPWAIPQYISGFTWRYLFNEDIGFINQSLSKIGLGTVPWLSHPTWSMVAVVIANTWVALPFNILVFLGGLQSIPPDLYEAAEVDGANPMQRFLYVTLPLLRPVMFVATLLGIIWTFNAFNIIFLVTGGGPYRKTEVLATWAWRLGFNPSGTWNFGVAAAYSVIILLLLLLFSTIYMRVLNKSGQGQVL